jgi:hypothetical protein
MTVSSAPMDLMHERQATEASKSVTEMLSQPLSQALFQNKTFLSELANADPGTVNTIMGLLNDLLSASVAASIAFTTDVNTALVDENAKNLVLSQATNAKTAADAAFTLATSEFDAADIHHTAMVDELAAKQPGVNAESDAIRSTIAIVRTLLPQSAQPQNFQWEECAVEGYADDLQTCTCSTTVRYAVDLQSEFQITDDMNGKTSILCDNAHFSDPHQGAGKKCFCALA